MANSFRNLFLFCQWNTRHTSYKVFLVLRNFLKKSSKFIYKPEHEIKYCSDCDENFYVVVAAKPQCFYTCFQLVVVSSTFTP